MTPFFFGERTRKLYGVYHPARDAGVRPRAAVLCYPWGPEYIEAHRSVRWLAASLAGVGVHTLRFDYFGSGDSAGEIVEGEADGWRADIATAMEELKDVTGAPRVSLVGLRLGGLLAAKVAVERPREVDALVLWDPVITGGEYRTELEQTARKATNAFKLPVERAPEAGAGLDVLGYPMPARLLTQLDSLDLQALAPQLPSRTLLLVTADEAELNAAQASLRGQPSLSVLHAPAAPCWIESWPVAPIPVKALQAIVDWLP